MCRLQNIGYFVQASICSNTIWSYSLLLHTPFVIKHFSVIFQWVSDLQTATGHRDHILEIDRANHLVSLLGQLSWHPLFLIKSVQLIWRYLYFISNLYKIRVLHLRVPDPQMSCCDKMIGCRFCTPSNDHHGHMSQYFFALQGCHNGRDGISNHQPRLCLLNRWFRRRSKKALKPRVTGLCEGNSPVIGKFPAQMTINVEKVSIWWRHHGQQMKGILPLQQFTLYHRNDGLLSQVFRRLFHGMLAQPSLAAMLCKGMTTTFEIGKNSNRSREATMHSNIRRIQCSVWVPDSTFGSIIHTANTTP